MTSSGLHGPRPGRDHTTRPTAPVQAAHTRSRAPSRHETSLVSPAQTRGWAPWVSRCASKAPTFPLPSFFGTLFTPRPKRLVPWTRPLPRSRPLDTRGPGRQTLPSRVCQRSPERGPTSTGTRPDTHRDYFIFSRKRTVATVATVPHHPSSQCFMPTLTVRLCASLARVNSRAGGRGRGPVSV